jgi:hypothetical protein
MEVSANGLYIIGTGYGVTSGTAGITATTASRAILRVALDGTMNTDTRITNALGSSGNFRGVISNDGTQFWGATSDKGVWYTSSFGSTVAETQIVASSPANVREVNIYNGQLYISSATNPMRGVSSVGTGLPTSAATATLLTGMPGNTLGTAFNDFQFVSATKLYATDSADGGVEEWTYNAGTWTKTASSGASTVTGNPTLAIGSDGNGNQVAFVTDNGNSIKKYPLNNLAGFSTIYSAPSNRILRGIVVIPGALAGVKDWNNYGR